MSPDVSGSAATPTSEPVPSPTPPPPGGAGGRPDREAAAAHRRLAAALLLSLLVHGLLASLTFGGHGFGLPGLQLPWRERRAEVPELRIRIAAPTVAAP
ncbi:MAG: hypothetical protein KF683_22135, partial [Rubrivivax sp.]|nr:hypothetical protein [Rubrivivax sp.]